MVNNNLCRHTRLLVVVVCGCTLLFAQSVSAEQYAILVGIWDYENPNLKLDAPPNDLQLMKAVLAARGVSQDRVHILANPDKAGIERKFRELSGRLTAADRLLFYFSGHGARIIDKFGTFPGDEAKGRYPDQNDESLLPVDVNLASPETYLLDDELNSLLSEFQTRQITCIIDTCYSGDILREIRLGLPKGAPVGRTLHQIRLDTHQKGVPVTPEETTSRQSLAVSRTEDILDDAADFAVLLAAASYNEVVHELRLPIRNDYLPVSAMTYSIYRRLMVHAEQTYAQLLQQIQADHQAWNLPWTPVLEGAEGRFDESFLQSPPIAPAREPLRLVTTSGQTVDFEQVDLIYAGGQNFAIGLSRAPDMKRWAIVIGVDTYPPPFQSLKYSGSDAKAVTSVFQEAGYIVTLMTPDSLMQPTKANIVEQLEWHAQLEEVELLTVYLSGHGDAVDGVGYFLPMDVTEPFMESGLSLRALFATLSKAGAKHRFVVVDACRVAPKQHFIAELSRYSEESNIIFTACDSNQWAPEVPQLEHGLFTYFLLKGLRGDGGRDRGAAGPEGTVTVLGLLDYVTRGIEDWHAHLPEGLHMPQQITPRVFYNGKYISLLNNQGTNPMVLNNQGVASRLKDWMAPITKPFEPNSHTAKPGVFEPMPSKADDEYTHIPVTVSFVPGLSTIGFGRRRVVTNLSFNIIAGYHAKLDGFEFGGVANIEEVEVRGAQFAGTANIVGGYVEGFQAAGALNAAAGDLDGWQASGAVNLVGGDARAVQLAGALNVVGRQLKGLQVAGAANIVGGNTQSVQIAGALNVAGHRIDGLQVSGALNVAEHLEGTQISAVNIANGVVGTQIGVVNIGRHVEGLQLGVVNVAGSISGAPIGLVSLVKDNLLHLHFWGSDTEAANIALRLGSRNFYNLLMIGFQPDETPVRWSYGIGLGGRIPLGHGLAFNIDAVSRDVHYDSLDYDGVNLLNKLRFALAWEQHQRFTVFGGVAFNVFVSNERDGSDIAYGLDSVIESGDTTVRMWPGLFVGVQF